MSVLVGLATAHGAGAPLLGPDARITLITMDQGYDIYLAFGHSALRVVDPSLDMDLMFNYGTFDLRDPMFLPKFIKGDLNYYLSVSDFDLQAQYDLATQNRIWEEQVLLLAPSDRQALFEALVDNALPEHAYYRYDFILDNCATRVRDVLKLVLGERLRFRQGTHAEGLTWRRLLDHHVQGRPLYPFGFSLLLGTRVDMVPEGEAAMALPFFLRDEFAHGEVLGSDGTWSPLVSASVPVVVPHLETNHDTPLESPQWLLVPLAMASGLGLLTALRHRRIPWWAMVFDAIWFGFWGTFAVVLVYLTAFSSHWATGGNLTLVWLWPVHLLVPVFLIFAKRLPWLRWYFLIAAIAALLPLILWPLWPQGQHPAQISFMAIFVLRGLTYFIGIKKDPA